MDKEQRDEGKNTVYKNEQHKVKFVIVQKIKI